LGDNPDSDDITNYYYNGSPLLFTSDGDNAKISENILTPSGSIVASMRFEGDYADEYYFFNYDIRQSVTSIVDDSLTLMQGYEYKHVLRILRGFLLSHMCFAQKLTQK